MAAIVGWREDPALYQRALESYRRARGCVFLLAGIDGERPYAEYTDSEIERVQRLRAAKVPWKEIQQKHFPNHSLGGLRMKASKLNLVPRKPRGKRFTKEELERLLHAKEELQLPWSEIQKRVHWAYAVLTDSMDSTEKRFRSLEID